MKHLKDEHGMAFIVEIVLVAIVLAVVGLAVYASTQAKKTTSTVKTQSSPSATPTPTPNPTANWTKYNSSTGKFSLRYNPGWKVYTFNSYALSTCHKDAKDNMLDIDTLRSANTAIGCGGEAPGQVHISSIEGAKNLTASFSADTSLYTDIKNETVTVDGVEGVRYSATSLQNLMALQKGEKTVEYHFYANGRNYSLVMEQHASSSDITNDFDLMVKTLKFSS
jgi:hypothetical protein